MVPALGVPPKTCAVGHNPYSADLGSSFLVESFPFFFVVVVAAFALAGSFAPAFIFFAVLASSAPALPMAAAAELLPGCQYARRRARV